MSRSGVRSGIGKSRPPKKRKPPPIPAKNLAADRTGIPNALNILKGDIFWRRDGTIVNRGFVDAMKRLRGRKI